MRKGISAICCATALMVGLGVGNALAQPSSKVSFKGSGIKAIRLSAIDPSTLDPALIEEGADIGAKEGWANVWGSPIIVKTPADKDLVMSFSAECGLVTNTKVMSREMVKAVANAEAMIEIRVLVDGDPVRVGPSSTFDDSGAGFDTIDNYDYSTTFARDGFSVIYARRAQSLIAEFAGDFADCMVTDGSSITITEECVDPETLQLVLSTMNANSFDFVAPDLAAEEHEIMVQARLTYDTDVEYTAPDSAAQAAATAFLGYSSFTMDTVRMVKDTDPIEGIELQ